MFPRKQKVQRSSRGHSTSYNHCGACFWGNFLLRKTFTQPSWTI